MKPYLSLCSVNLAQVQRRKHRYIRKKKFGFADIDTELVLILIDRKQRQAVRLNDV